MTAESIPAMPLPAREVEAVSHCQTCIKFDKLQRAAAALADLDALPASVYFKIGQFTAAPRIDHMRRYHPALHAYNLQAEVARRAALGIQP